MNIPASEFTVRLTEAGEYTALTESKNFEGSYGFAWEYGR